MKQNGVLDWLLEEDAGNPGVRYFALRDLVGKGDDDPEVVAARQAVMATGPVPVILGLLPFKTFRHAQFLHYEVPGIEVPPAALERMEAAAAKGKEAELAEGVAIVRELLAQLKGTCQGVYVVPPFGKYDVVARILA